MMPRRLIAVAAVLVLAQLSCVWPLTPSNPNSISGQVQVELQTSDPNGTPTGTRTIDRVSGIRVHVLAPGFHDSTRTVAGAFRFAHLPAGDYAVVVGVGGVFTDTMNVGIRPKDDLVIPTPLVLRRTGELRAIPNPFSFQVILTFVVPTDTPARLQVDDLTGSLRRVVLVRTFVAGAHQVTWDGANDAGKPLPDGLYAVVFLAGADRRLVIVSKEP